MIIVLALILICLSLAILYAQSQRLTCDYYKVEVEDYSGAGLRILFFSDFHFGLGKSKRRARNFVKKMQDAEADLILFGGDFFTEPAKIDAASLKLYSELFQNLGQKAKVYAVRGNHDAGSPEVRRAFSQVCEQLNWRLLENELIYLEKAKIILIGLRDYIHETAALDLQAEEIAVPGTLRICLLHEPDILPLYPPASGPSLILSGHSHAGQIAFGKWQPVLPRHGRIFTRGFYRLPQLKKLPANNREAAKIYGFKPEKGKLKMQAERYAYVSTGSGCTHLPLRFAARQSFLLLELKPSKEASFKDE